MKNIIKRLGPQSRALCAAAFVAAVVFSLAGCEDGPDSGGYSQWGLIPRPLGRLKFSNTNKKW